MTIYEAVEHFDSLTHNQLPLPTKVYWLSLLDSHIYRSVLSTHKGCAPESFNGYTAATDTQTALLVPHPYDEIYRWYLEMKTWDTLGEMAKYNNAAQKYNTILLGFMDYINRTRKPLGQSGLRLL